MTLGRDVLATGDRSVPGEAGIQGERRLCLAILQDALELALGRIPARPRERDEALEWIRSEADTPFGFERVCSELGFDPADIRRKVEEQIAAAANPEPAAVISENGDRELPPASGPEVPPAKPPPVARRPRRLGGRRSPCPICGKALDGPWREELSRAVPLDGSVRAVGIVTLRFCTGCVTLFVEGTFVGEVHIGSRS